MGQHDQGHRHGQRRDFSIENWEISRYDGNFSVTVSWDSNHFGQFARLWSNIGVSPSQIIIPAGFSLEGLKLFCKGLSELLKNTNGVSIQLPLPEPETVREGIRSIIGDKDEGWRCFQGIATDDRVDEEQQHHENRLCIDKTMETEVENMQKHTSLAEVPIDQDCLKIFHQVIRDNINLFKKSMANK
ncbi:unnamed protein product [Cuscuta campestris]|uniref:Uncharacterized protein n=1 Tax=Cuscuta campestris TaxID=132261 RepID=A0A484L9N9_9ASTE|nr:unnamed protein product [Cuscuta campestris]